MVRWFFVVSLILVGCGGADPSRVGLPLLAEPPVAEPDAAPTPAQDAGSLPTAPDAAPPPLDAAPAQEDAGQAPDAADAPDADLDAGVAPDSPPPLAECTQLSRDWELLHCPGPSYTAWDCSDISDGKYPVPHGVGTCVPSAGQLTYCCAP